MKRGMVRAWVAVAAGTMALSGCAGEEGCSYGAETATGAVGQLLEGVARDDTAAACIVLPHLTKQSMADETAEIAAFLESNGGIDGVVVREDPLSQHGILTVVEAVGTESDASMPFSVVLLDSRRYIVYPSGTETWPSDAAPADAP